MCTSLLIPLGSNRTSAGTRGTGLTGDSGSQATEQGLSWVSLNLYVVDDKEGTLPFQIHACGADVSGTPCRRRAHTLFSVVMQLRLCA
jgi:hypothetical protein